MIASLFSSIWAKLALVGAILLALLGIFTMIRKSGSDAERAAELKAGLDRIKKANDAAAKVDNSPDAIANDPQNLDRAH